MSYFDKPPGERTLREFAIRRSPDGRWIVTEIDGALRRAFDSHADAVRFALRKAEGEADRVHFEDGAS